MPPERVLLIGKRNTLPSSPSVLAICPSDPTAAPALRLHHRGETAFPCDRRSSPTALITLDSRAWAPVFLYQPILAVESTAVFREYNSRPCPSPSRASRQPRVSPAGRSRAGPVGHRWTALYTNTVRYEPVCGKATPKGSRKMIVSSRCGLVPIRPTGTPTNSSIRCTYLAAARGSFGHSRTP
jgi:hypothetical protein